MDADDGSDAMPDVRSLVRSFAVGHAAEARLSDLCCTTLNGAVRFVNTGDVPLDMNTLEAEAALVNPPSGATVMMIPRPDTLLLPPGSAAGLLAESVAVLLESQVPEPVIDDTHNYFDLVINGLPPDGPFDFDVNVIVRIDGVDANFTVRVRYQQNVHAYTVGRRTDSEVVVVE